MTASLEPVRLVIWDLDETFWRGTLTEGGISEYIQTHHDLVIHLARRGIISSICSKNDFNTIEKILIEKELWDYFVFPSIDWSAKGPRVANLIESIQLRPETVRFIDDNPSNLAEVAAAVPGIQVFDHLSIDAMWTDPLFKGKDDSKETRLKQYKVLQQRKKDENQAVSSGQNLEFLRSCGIKVKLEYDLASHADRVLELINRTNQLNFTKRRVSPEEVQAFFEGLDKVDRQGALIHVSDRYGDYGFAGFYLKRGTEQASWLEHFCFSCRILGMGVEAWLYQLLGAPILEVVGEVLSSPAEAPRVDWINLQADATVNSSVPALRLPGVRLTGACELDAIAHYLRFHADEVVSRTSQTRGGVWFRMDVAHMHLPRTDEQANALRRLSFEDKELESILVANRQPGGAVVASFIGDTKAATYRHRESGAFASLSVHYLPYDVTSISQAECEKIFDEHPNHFDRPRASALVQELHENWEFIGPFDVHVAVEQTGRIVDLFADDKHVVVLLPATRGSKDGVFLELDPIFESYCSGMESLRQGRPNLVTVRFDDCVATPTDIDDEWGMHFQRRVYARMAEKIVESYASSQHRDAPARPKVDA